MQLHEWCTIPFADLKYFDSCMRRTFWQALRRYFGIGVSVNKPYAYRKLQDILSVKWGLLAKSVRNYHEGYNKRVVKHLEQLAKAGHPVAEYLFAASQLKLGNEREAVRMLVQSSRAGFTPAMYKLGRLWIKSGKPEFVSEGNEFLRKAASLGHAKSISHVGLPGLSERDVVIVCTALRVPTPHKIHWLHAFVVLNDWRKLPLDARKRSIIETICFVVPSTATDEELAVFQDIMYNKGAQSFEWLNANKTALSRLSND